MFMIIRKKNCLKKECKGTNLPLIYKGLRFIFFIPEVAEDLSPLDVIHF